MRKSFRGKLADGSIEQIRLRTNDGLTGYQIVKFQLMGKEPGTTSNEHVVKIFSNNTNEAGNTRTADGVINFTDPTLLAAAYLEASTSVTATDTLTVIFDNSKINQDIFVTHVDVEGNSEINYYIELEQIKLSKDEATIATLKDMRAGPDTNFGP